MVFDILGYNRTNQEGKNRISPNASQLEGHGRKGLSKKLITLPFISHK